MRALQLIYTSWKNGNSPDKGFMVYSKSEAVSEEEKNEIRERMHYTSPTDLPYAPSQDEILNEFPINYSFFPLKSGKYCIAQATYLGKDYSGRYGNYIIYALIIPESELDLYPAELYGADFIRTCLTEEELNLESKPEPMPQINIDSSTAAQFVNNDCLMEFINDYREEYFKYFLSAVIEAADKKIPLCINDTRENLIFWMAAAQKSFPLSIAKLFTFNTYLFDFENKSLLCNGVRASGSYFSYSANKDSSRAIVLDFQNSIYSEGFRQSKFAELAAVGLTFSYDTLTDFHDFINTSTYRKISWEINDGYNVYRLSNGESLELTDEELIYAINFATRYCNSEIGEIVAERIIDIVESSITIITPDKIHPIFGFFFKNAVHLLSRSYQLLFDCIFELVSTPPKDTKVMVEDAISALEDEYPDCMNGFVDFLTTRENLKQLETLMADNPNWISNRFYIKYLIRIGGSVRSREKFEEIFLVIQVLLKNIYNGKEVTENVISILEESVGNKNLFLWILLDYCRGVARDTNIRKTFYLELAKLLDRQTNEWVADISRMMASSEDTFEIIIDTYMYRISTSSKPSDEFWSFYFKQVVPYLGKINIDLASIVFTYLNCVDPDRLVKESFKVIEKLDLKYLNNRILVKKMMESIEKAGIEEFKRYDDNLLEKVIKLKVQTKCDVMPNTTDAVLFGRMLAGVRREQVDRKAIKDLIKYIEYIKFDKLEKRQYKDYIGEFFWPVVRLLKEPEYIGTVLKLYASPENEGLLIDSYIGALKKIERKEKNIYEDLMLNTSLCLINDKSNSILIKLRPEFVKHYIKMGDEMKERVNNRIMTAASRAASRSFFDEIEYESSRTLGSRLSSLFKKK